MSLKVCKFPQKLKYSTKPFVLKWTEILIQTTREIDLNYRGRSMFPIKVKTVSHRLTTPEQSTDRITDTLMSLT